VSAPLVCPACGVADCDHAYRARRALELALDYTLEEAGLPADGDEPTAWD
jgi:hypothetical protein